MRFKCLSLIMISMLVVASGCQMDNEKQKQENLEDMKKEDLPDVRAFQDEFTRGFLQSTEETRPGYYPFLSGTGAYEMDFPENGKVSEEFYNIKDKSYEAIAVNNGTQTSSINHDINIQYYNHLNGTQKDSRLEQLQSQIGSDVEIEKIKDQSKTIYIGYFQGKEVEDGKDVYGYGALIFNEKESGGIEVILTSYCNEDCKKLKEKDMEQTVEWLNSFDYIEEPDSDENGE